MINLILFFEKMLLSFLFSEIFNQQKVNVLFKKKSITNVSFKMETFEINSLLRLLRSSVKSSPSTSSTHHVAQSHPNPAAATNNFIVSGQRFETLKALKKQLRKAFSESKRSSSSISFSLIQSVFEVLKSILNDVVSTYFER